MKKLFYAIASLFIVASVLSSCSSDNQALSQFSKRKYLKKFKSKNVKYEDRIEEREVNLAFDNVLLASTEKTIVIGELTKEMEQEVLVEKLATKYEKQLEKLSSHNKEYTEWNNYNRDFKYFERGENQLEKHSVSSKKKSSGSDVSAVVLVILCILLITAPLAVYLYEDAITANFWLDLILLLTLIGAAIYALLVCFADVSIS